MKLYYVVDTTGFFYSPVSFAVFYVCHAPIRKPERVSARTHAI